MLLQHVGYAKSFKGRNKYWKTEEFEKMISPEALTSILSQKVFLILQIRRMLKNKLGISNQKIEEAKNSQAL